MTKGDLISRKSLLNKINAYVVGSQDKEFICKLIKEMPSVENKGEWIPVSERNPDIYKKVEKYLITDDEGQVRTACFVSCGDACWWDYLHVVAWQPLPEPYKGGE